MGSEKSRRPENWNLYNARVRSRRKHARVPAPRTGRKWTFGNISKKKNWKCRTFISATSANIYRRGGQWIPIPPPHTDASKPDSYAGARPKPNEPVKKLIVRVRTIADMISTGMIESKAYTVDDIIAEISAARVTERGTRADDKASEAAMEDRKKAGYF